MQRLRVEPRSSGSDGNFFPPKMKECQCEKGPFQKKNIVFQPAFFSDMWVFRGSISCICILLLSFDGLWWHVIFCNAGIRAEHFSPRLGSFNDRWVFDSKMCFFGLHTPKKELCILCLQNTVYHIQAICICNSISHPSSLSLSLSVYSVD